MSEKQSVSRNNKKSYLEHIDGISSQESDHNGGSFLRSTSRCSTLMIEPKIIKKTNHTSSKPNLPRPINKQHHIFPQKYVSTQTKSIGSLHKNGQSQNLTQDCTDVQEFVHLAGSQSVDILEGDADDQSFQVSSNKEPLIFNQQLQMFETQLLRKKDKNIESIIKQNRKSLFVSETSQKLQDETPKIMNRSRNMSSYQHQTQVQPKLFKEMTIFDRLKGSNSTTSRFSGKSSEKKSVTTEKKKFISKKKPVLNVKINLFEPKLNPSKISTKQNGCIYAYGANTYQEDCHERVSIVTNLSNSAQKMCLFGIYCSAIPQDESFITEFLRDNLHRKIQCSSSFPDDCISAVRHSISEMFTSIQMQRNPMLITIFEGKQVLVVNSQNGPRAVLSSNEGRNIQMLSESKIQVVDKVQFPDSNSFYYQRQNPISEDILSYDLSSGDHDFIIMGPEQILESAVKMTWQTIQENPNVDLHQLAGKCAQNIIQNQQKSCTIIVLFLKSFRKKYPGVARGYINLQKPPLFKKQQ